MSGVGDATADPPGHRRGRRWAWVGLFVVLAGALVIGALGSTGPSTNEDRVAALSKVINCPTCNGQTVSDSNSDMSRNIRVDIAERVGKGQSDEDILAFYAQRYDDGALLNPTATGVNGFVWVTPVVVLVVALAGLALAFRRWGGHAAVAATDADRSIVADALETFDESARDDDGNDPDRSRQARDRDDRARDRDDDDRDEREHDGRDVGGSDGAVTGRGAST